MKKKSTSQSAPARRSLGEGGFFNLRVLIASLFCLTGVAIAMLGMGAFSSAFAQAKGTRNNQASPGTQTPDVVRMVGPVRMNTDLRDLPYIPPAPRIVGAPLKRFPPTGGPPAAESETSAFAQVQSLLGKIVRPIPNIPPPLLTFDAVPAAQSA